MLDGSFPLVQYAMMREALLQHVSHVETRIGGGERTVELARLLDVLEYLPSSDKAEDAWVIGDMLHGVLIDAIKRYKGRMEFVDDLVTMLSATQSYEAIRGR